MVEGEIGRINEIICYLEWVYAAQSDAVVSVLRGFPRI